MPHASLQTHMSLYIMCLHIMSLSCVSELVLRCAIQVDIWSLGGAVLEMATGQPPWACLNLRTPVALIQWVKR
jgi:serine/threonine protein kinase